MNASLRSVLLALLSVIAVRGATFTSDTIIDFTNTTYDGADVVVTNCAVTINGPHAFASLQILNGGKLTHQPSDSGLFYMSFQTNEPLVLAGTKAVALGQTNVTPGSIVVRNLAGTIIYTNGVDYLLGGTLGVTTI